MRMNKFTLLVFLTFLSSTLFAGTAKIEIDHQEGELGETFNLSVAISGSLSGKVEIPPIADLEVMGSGSSTSISIINGSYSKETSYNFILVPQKEGTFTIPSMKLKIDDEWVNTEVITFTVRSGGTVPPPAAQNQRSRNPQAKAPDEDSDADKTSPNIFIEREFSKTSAFEGEPIIVTNKIYHRVQLANVENKSEKATGFRVFELKQYNTQEQRGNLGYNVIVVKQVLIPLRSGKITLPAFRINASMVMNSSKRQRGRSGSPFDLFDEFFNGSHSQLVNRVISSKDMTLEIKDTPVQGKPEKFRDLVGTFRIDAELSHSELKAGDTSTLTITIDGVGALDSMGTLDLDLGSNIRVYPDKPQLQEKPSDKYGLESKRVFRYALVPMHKGEYKLGSVKVPYFDPSTSSYHDLVADLGTLKVAEGDTSNVPALANTTTATASRTDVKSLASDLVDIHRKINLDDHQNLTAQDYTRASLLGGIPALLCLLALLWARLRTRTHNDTRAKGALKTFEKRISDLQSTKSDSFLEHSYSALRTYIGDKLNLHGAALTARELSSELSKKQMPQDLLHEVESLAKTIEQNQYASEAFTGTQAENLVDRMKKLAREIEKQC